MAARPRALWRSFEDDTRHDALIHHARSSVTNTFRTLQRARVRGGRTLPTRARPSARPFRRRPVAAPAFLRASAHHNTGFAL